MTNEAKSKFESWSYWGYDKKFYRRCSDEICKHNYLVLIKALSVIIGIAFLNIPFFGHLVINTVACVVFSTIFVILSIIIIVSFRYGDFSQAKVWVRISVVSTFLFALSLTNPLIPVSATLMVFFLALPTAFILPKSHIYSFMAVSITIFYILDITTKGERAMADIILVTGCLIIGSIFGKTANQAKMDVMAKNFLLETDTRTGIRNTAYLNRIIKEMPSNNDIALAIFDIDYFKIINDSLGYAAGDRIICAVAEKLQEVLAKRDLEIIRRSDAGDEFIVIATGFNARNIHVITQECLNAIRDLPTEKIGVRKDYAERYGASVIPEKITQLSLSGGYSVLPPKTHVRGVLPEEELQTLQEEAENALHFAKESGRNRICRYEKETIT